MQTNCKRSLVWYVWHACRKKQRDILSVVLVLAILRPLDYGWLFVACSAVSAMQALAWGLVCKELHVLELHFLFCVSPLSRSTVDCTERINSMESSFLLFSDTLCFLCTWRLGWHTVVLHCEAVMMIQQSSSTTILNKIEIVWVFFFF